MNHLTKMVNDYLDNAEDPEQEALTLLWSLWNRFGWMGVIMTKRDAETVAERPLSDEEFEEITRTWWWRKGASTWHEVGITWDTVRDAVKEAGIQDKEDLPLNNKES